MASALYTDIKKWKDGRAGSIFCRCAWPPAPRPPACRRSFLEKTSIGRMVRRSVGRCCPNR